jgi:hypothetical protein
LAFILQRAKHNFTPANAKKNPPLAALKSVPRILVRQGKLAAGPVLRNNARSIMDISTLK